MKSVLFAVAGLAMLAASPASANGWTIDDLGSMSSRDECMGRAERTMREYYKRHGGTPNIGKSTWTLGGYSLRGRVIDALIMCPTVAGLIEPFLVVHNSDSDNDARKIVADRVKAIWQSQ